MFDQRPYQASDSTAAGSSHDHGGSESDALHVHVVPLSLLVGIFLTLVVLTVVTVAVTRVDLGSANLWIAMLIAGVKATLVALYFMHLRWDRSFHGLIFLSGILFVVLFIGFALMDTQAYDPDLIPGHAPLIEQ